MKVWVPIDLPEGCPGAMNRRGFLGGLLAMPAIVRPGLLMPVRPLWRPKVFPPIEIMPGIFAVPSWEWNGPLAQATLDHMIRWNGWHNELTGLHALR